MSDWLIEVEDFSFAFATKRVLDGVSFRVRAGEYLSLIGPNGAGKSTLLKCLMRIHRGGTGRVRLAGRPLESYRQRELARLMSYVSQGEEGPQLFTVEEYVLMGRYPHLSPFTTFGPEDRRLAREALELTGVSELADRPLGALSGGEHQRVRIASALAQGAGLLLLDEPTTFLDPRHAAALLRLIRRVNRSHGITVLSVTHDINSAALESDRVLALRAGQVRYDGPAVGVMDNRVLEPVYDRRFEFLAHPHRPGALIILPESGEP